MGLSALVGFGSFADPELELQYATRARKRRSTYLRYMAGLAAAILFIYFVINPMILPGDRVAQFNPAALPLLALLLCYYLVLQSQLFPRLRWLDLVFFVPLSVLMANLALVLANSHQVSGLPASIVISGNAHILLLFSELSKQISPSVMAGS